MHAKTWGLTPTVPRMETDNPRLDDEIVLNDARKESVFEAPVPTEVSLVHRYCSSILKNPLSHLLGYFFVVLGLCVVVLAMNVFEISEIGQYDWTVPDGPASTAEDAYLHATGIVDTAENVTQKSRSRPITRGTFQIIYDSVNENQTIFTPENLQAMCEFEALITNSEEYRTLCLTDEPNGYETICRLPQTSLVANVYSQAYPDFDYSSCDLLSSFLVDLLITEFDNRLQTPEGRSEVGFFVDKGYLERGFAVSSRAVIQLAAPLDGYSGESDRFNEQEKKYNNFVLEFEKRMFDKYDLNSVILSSGYRDDIIVGNETSLMEIRVFSQFLFDAQLDEQVIGDLVMVVGALMFVSLWMVLHTRTVFVTAMSMVAILASLVVSFFFYRFAFGIVYYTELHILTVFLILGIGADNTFVFYDSWQQYKFAKYPARLADSGLLAKLVDSPKIKGDDALSKQLLLARLSVTYAHTASSVFNTSFTTATAFFATAISPIMPVSTFGIYAAICIIINYLYVLTIIPATVVVHHYYMEGKPFCQALCCCCNMNKSNSGVEEAAREKRSSSARPSDENDGQSIAETIEGSINPQPSFVMELNDEEMLEEEADAAGTWIERGFEKLYVPLMMFQIPGTTIKPVPLLLVIGCIVYTGFSTYWAFQLESPIKFEENFAPDHMFTGFQDDFAINFLGGTQSQFESGLVIWGIQGVDRKSSGYNRFIPGENRGFAVFNDEFEFADPRSQMLFRNTCDAIGVAECSASGCVGGTLASKDTTICFLKNFQEWIATPENGGFNSTLELGASDPELFYSKLYTFSTTTTQPSGDTWAEMIGFVDGKLEFVAVKFVTTLALLQSAGVVVPVENIFVDVISTVVDSFIESRPADEPRDSGLLQALADFKYLIGQRTRWNETQFFLVDGMINGFIICFPVAFVVLLFATLNLPLALFAIIAIASIVGCVMGFVQHFMGWYLAISEALVAVLIIGFSVDYVVHLGHTYMEAGSPQVGLRSREDRFKYAARNMGPTVLAGAITTAGAGAFMFFTQLAFFAKMAILITATIAFSTLFAHGFFMGLCILIGPQGDSGMINKCCKKKES